MPKIVDKEAMRAKILEAAFAVFAERGYHAAKMTDIATAAGLAKGTLYIYFKSKEALTTSLVRMIFADVETKIIPQGDIQTFDGLLEQLRHALDAPEEAQGETRMFFEVMGPSFNSEEVVTEIANFFDRIGASYTKNLKILMANGEVRGGIDADAYGRMMASVVDGMVTHRALFGLPDVRYGKMLDAAMTLLDRGLRA